MTGSIGGLIVAVTATAIAVSIASTIAQTGTLREITRIAGSLLLILVIVTPFLNKSAASDITLSGRVIKQDIEKAAEEGVKKQETLIKSTVASQMSQYIEEKAKSDGIACSVKFSAAVDQDGFFSITSAEITYQNTPTQEQKDSITKLIADECGVPADRQEHKGR